MKNDEYPIREKIVEGLGSVHLLRNQPGELHPASSVE
jgi:hypothetical protein